MAMGDGPGIRSRTSMVCSPWPSGLGTALQSWPAIPWEFKPLYYIEADENSLLPQKSRPSRHFLIKAR